MIPKPNYKPRKPKRGARGRITKGQYQLALDWFGDSCNYCNATPIEMHHVRYKSLGGRGGFRNIVPLCKKCHGMAHSSREFADSWITERIEAFGEHFYKDEHDLYELGLIENATKLEFDNYMKLEKGIIK